MKKVFFLIALLVTNISHACDEELSRYLDEARSIAIKLPQKNETLEKSRKYNDEHWIKDPSRRRLGGYRYLIHDIAVSYSKINCWEQALSTADHIENLGVKDSAWAEIAIEHAKSDRFDGALKLIKAIKYPKGGEVARKYVSKELVRAGRYEEARKVLRGAGIFGNHYHSYYYQNALNLAKAGKHSEAVDYVSSLGGVKNHVRNSFGDMLLLFQAEGDSSNSRKILSYYEDRGYEDAPIYQIATYYLRANDLEKSREFISKIGDPRRTAQKLLDLAIVANSEQSYNEALAVIDAHFNKDPNNNWTIVVQTAYKVFLFKGQKVSNRFIYKYIDKNDHKAKIAHINIIEELFSDHKPGEVIEYLSNVDEKIDKRSYIETIANIRTKKLKEVPDISVADNNSFIYRFVVIELLKNGYSVVDVIDAIEKNYQSESSKRQKSELLCITAMVASSSRGTKNAVDIYGDKEDDLLRAYWLIGISQKNEAHEIDSAQKYDLYI